MHEILSSIRQFYRRSCSRSKIKRICSCSKQKRVGFRGILVLLVFIPTACWLFLMLPQENNTSYPRAEMAKNDVESTTLVESTTEEAETENTTLPYSLSRGSRGLQIPAPSNFTLRYPYSDINQGIYYALMELWYRENRTVSRPTHRPGKYKSRIMLRKGIITESSTKPARKAIMTPNVLPSCNTTVAFVGQIKLNVKETLKNWGLSPKPLNELYPEVSLGGYYRPANCVSRDKVAIFVPYRNRTENLITFLVKMHPFLKHQMLEYRIFVVEQYGNNTFNKGRVFNAGFKEVMKYDQWKCIIFHDVDLLPLNSRILYTCPSFPRHMSPVFFTSKGVRYCSWSSAMFGGVTAITPQHFELVNGYSNLYWGWGAEDNDMYWRIRGVGLPVFRYDKVYAQYLALPHPRLPENPDRYKLLHTAFDRWKLEGLNDIEYVVKSASLEHLYTHIVVDIDVDP